MGELYLHSAMHLHGVVLSSVSILRYISLHFKYQHEHIMYAHRIDTIHRHEMLPSLP
jgi:hypothetical protein